MKQERRDELEAYYRGAESWAEDRQKQAASSKKIAWLVAGGACTIAVLEAIALAAVAPLKTVVPYTLLVDRQTGYVEALKPIERQTIAPDAALTRSFLAQYVLAREGFDIGSLRAEFRKVALWSAPDVRSAYVAATQAGSPTSPLTILPRNAVIEVAIKSVSSLGNDTSLVRFETRRADLAGQAEAPQSWAAVISYRYSGERMTVEDRLINPLGFVVTRYRKDAETIPAPATSPAIAAESSSVHDSPALPPQSRPAQSLPAGTP